MMPKDNLELEEGEEQMGSEQDTGAQNHGWGRQSKHRWTLHSVAIKDGSNLLTY